MREKTPTMHFLESTHLVENAYEQAKGMLAKETIDPRMYIEEFAARYGRKEVEKDLYSVDELKKKFLEKAARESEKETARKMARILEAIIHQQSELSEWLGSEAFTIKTSDHDDYKNGIDTIVEFRRPEETSHLALAIDVTMTTFGIGEKLLGIQHTIERGRLGSVKYFISEDRKEIGLQKIPHVVIGIDGRTVKELARLWLEKQNKLLGEHKVQFMILEEIRMQLEAFGRFAQSQRINRPDLAMIFSDMYRRIEEVMEEKGRKGVPGEFMEDRTFAALKEYCDGIGR